MSVKEELFAELNHGSPHQRFMAALKFYKGEGVTRNLRLALQGFESLAAEGDEEAIVRVIRILLEGGIGVTRNPARAAVLLKYLCEKNDSWAQYQLGCLYDHGYGVQRNPLKAFELYEKAATPKEGGILGHIHATFTLMGMHLAEGLGKRIKPDQYPHDADLRKAAQYCRRLIRARYSAYQGKAFYEMGRFYEHGYGVRKNIGRALVFYRKAKNYRYPESAEAAKMAAAAVKRLEGAPNGLAGLLKRFTIPKPSGGFRAE